MSFKDACAGYYADFKPCNIQKKGARIRSVHYFVLFSGFPAIHSNLCTTNGDHYDDTSAANPRRKSRGKRQELRLLYAFQRVEVAWRWYNVFSFLFFDSWLLHPNTQVDSLRLAKLITSNALTLSSRSQTRSCCCTPHARDLPRLCCKLRNKRQLQNAVDSRANFFVVPLLGKDLQAYSRGLSIVPAAVSVCLAKWTTTFCLDCLALCRAKIP